MPVYIREQNLLNLTYDAVETWRTSHECKAYVVLNRLESITPEEFLTQLQKRTSIPIELIPPDNYSVAESYNVGMRAAFRDRFDLVAITGNDVKLAPDTLDTLLAFESIAAERNIWFWFGLDTRDRPLNGIDRSAITMDMGGALGMLCRSTIERVGWYDRHFKPAYYEDVDFVARIWNAGGEIAAIHSALYYHHGSMTIRLDPEAKHHVDHWFGINTARFVAKWGSMPVNTKAEALQRYFRSPWNNPDSPISFVDH